MSRSPREHKIYSKYSDGLDSFIGDQPSSSDSDAATIISVLAEAGKGAAALAAKKAAEKKNAASNKDLYDMGTQATNARKAAELAKADAIAETDAKGPLHQKAASLDSAARVLEAKYNVLNKGGSMADATKAADLAAHGGKSGKSGGLPSWVLPAGIAVGSAGVLALILKLIFRRK